MNAAITYAAHEGNLIWGVGATPEAALDAAADMDSSLRASCTTDVVTPELAAMVENMGGNVSYGRLPDGRLGTGDQEYDAA